MKRKELVKEGGRYVERYVDKGPGRALSNHGRPIKLTHRVAGGGIRATVSPPRGLGSA